MYGQVTSLEMSGEMDARFQGLQTTGRRLAQNLIGITTHVEAGTETAPVQLMAYWAQGPEDPFPAGATGEQLIAWAGSGNVQSMARAIAPEDVGQAIEWPIEVVPAAGTRVFVRQFIEYADS